MTRANRYVPLLRLLATYARHASPDELNAACEIVRCIITGDTPLGPVAALDYDIRVCQEDCAH